MDAAAVGLSPGSASSGTGAGVGVTATATAGAGAAAGAGSAGDSPHALTLKVMRVSRPLLETHTPLLPCVGDIGSERVLAEEAFGVSPLLVLPASFGNIFVGQRFSVYLSLSNTSPFGVSGVALRVELQTTAHKHQLLDVADTGGDDDDDDARARARLASGARLDFVVVRGLEEEGVHLLVCSISYVRHDGVRRDFRKFFKFHAASPLAVHTRVHDDSPHDLLVAAHVENSAAAPLFLESVRLLPAACFAAADVAPTAGLLLKPRCAHQFLFRLAPVPPNEARARMAQTLGRVRIVWRLPLGDGGAFETPPIERTPRARGDLELTVRDFPARIVLERPFVLSCVVTNRGAAVVRARLVIADDDGDGAPAPAPSDAAGISFLGLSGTSLGAIAPGESAAFSLALLPRKPGVEHIPFSALAVVDTHSGRRHSFSEKVDVFVHAV